jgi:hypothetical protein
MKRADKPAETSVNDTPYGKIIDDPHAPSLWGLRAPPPLPAWLTDLLKPDQTSPR